LPFHECGRAGLGGFGERCPHALEHTVCIAEFVLPEVDDAEAGRSQLGINSGVA
jgi:hypothetical protein